MLLFRPKHSHVPPPPPLVLLFRKFLGFHPKARDVEFSETTSSARGWFFSKSERIFQITARFSHKGFASVDPHEINISGLYTRFLFYCTTVFDIK